MPIKLVFKFYLYKYKGAFLLKSNILLVVKHYKMLRISIGVMTFSNVREWECESEGSDNDPVQL